MKKYLPSILFGLALFILGMMISLAGYGHVLVYGQLFIILGILFFVVILTFRKKQSSFALYISNCVIVLLLGITGLAVGSWTLVYRKKAVCAECDKVLAVLEKHKAQNGRYPETLSVVNVQEITDIAIQQEQMYEGGIDVVNINKADATIYLSPSEYLCLVPVTKRLPMSITRFYALERNNTVTKWKYQKFIWFLSASD